MASISEIVARGNQAIAINPPSSSVDIHLTSHGSDWLWAAFSVFATLALVHTGLFAATPSSTKSLKKFFTLVPLFTNAIFAYTYFTYASNLGWTSTPVEFHHVSTSEGLDVRQIFYVKFIGWFLGWPFVLLATEVATHSIEVKYDTSSELITKLFNIFSSLVAKVLTIEVFVLGLLIGALIHSSYKWGYFTFAVSAELFAISLIVNSIVRSLKTSETKKAGIAIVVFQLVIMVLYPICWGLSEGGNKIQPDSEAAFYGILDVINFGILPSALTFINTIGMDEGFLNKLLHLRSNEKVVETPRQSGETGETAV
ncbi:plasma membrane heat shock protein [Yamadazyma tenuis]|uniref:Family A G protein-coupled receptor-like protein n=1 Tax=Candida tenuis (strain ATCC 10573 / BCRC 21748 / CBS 615 / JCM 9827 / NBRC 10315 / NRRL Y-1498 / VKM Y-70) TaxID=590646 RepID=G3B5P5_CANTC|nr:family A G protein-coupled receptor-like protein [Yamadazyma tenuis ATCC 10573]XP_006687396.1 uncharacterized protein CANTEDRAFT_114570 [Yamadazyma tenuis ATCC 10573]EGV63602.1 family A G protein-coupled receptor-like protein [Yamadazyma tenuis ATCC 10573]EGV63603.1 hypothetical protein CANTEDRAFT_114570 [Yamadazyma tenuis ATCC 10573]WEJ96906.1 plasma membrane heat shock protein [Yamadazyma tenuis]